MSENRYCAVCGNIIEGSQCCNNCYAKARDKGFEEGTRLAETAACCAADEAAKAYEELEEKHLSECRQISEYEQENREVLTMDRVLFSSAKCEWETPQDLFDKLNEEFHFTVDVCALPENAKCEKYFTPEMDGLAQCWEGVCWCNPPYGREIGKWVIKAKMAQSTGATVVMLIPARTDTKWFHEYIYNGWNVETRFIKGRLKFGGVQNSAPFPSMIVIFRPLDKFIPLKDCYDV